MYIAQWSQPLACHAVQWAWKEDKPQVSYVLGMCSYCEVAGREAGHSCYHWLPEVTSPGPKSAPPAKTIRWPPPNHAPYSTKH